MKKNNAYKTTIRILGQWSEIVGEWVERLDYAEANYLENPNVPNTIALYQEGERYEVFKQKVAYLLQKDNERLENTTQPAPKEDEKLPDGLVLSLEKYKKMSKSELGKILIKRIYKDEMIELLISMDACESADE